MVADRRKLVLAISALWVLASIPISEDLYREIWGDGLFMRIFSLVVVATPVWLFFGWKWLANGAPTHRVHMIVVGIAGVALAILAANTRRWEDVAYIPIIAVAVFPLLVAAEQWKVASNTQARPTASRFDPAKLENLEALNGNVAPLLRLTETIASEILQKMDAISARSPLPRLIQPKADATKAAYGLIHSAYISLPAEHQTSRMMMIFSMYQSHMTSNIVALSMPRIDGMPEVTSEILKDEKFREPIRKLLKIEEDNGSAARRKLEQGEPNPHFPFYENLRPYISPKATPEHLSATFENKFAELYSLAKSQMAIVVIRT